PPSTSYPALAFLLPLHPTRPTLFPSTPLFRSRQQPQVQVQPAQPQVQVLPPQGGIQPTIERAQQPQVHVEQMGQPRIEYQQAQEDRKSTRLNSSHVKISYAVFCLKKKKNTNHY